MPETELADLCTGELLLVASLRLYAMPFRDPGGCHPDWRGGFHAAGIEQIAVPSFRALFDIVSRVPLRPLEIGCPHCLRLAGDEAAFLCMTALHQRGRIGEAAAILLDWLPPAATRMAAMPALSLAFALQRGGLFLPLRREQSSAWTSPPDRGLGLLQ